ncbi:MAG TPA: L,D-transpeptidase family protein [Chryseosolibacter sp.]
MAVDRLGGVVRAGSAVFAVALTLLAFTFTPAVEFQPTAIDSLNFSVPENTAQLIVVTTQSWNSTEGELQRYDRGGGQWKKVGSPIEVVLGKNGLAWGLGLHKVDLAPKKKEGDAKAPAGVFSLGTMFGYGTQSPSKLGFPYRQSTVRDYFVDDVKSPAYNTWVTIPAGKENNPKAFWGSVEKMKRADQLYEYGIVINHNVTPVEKGKGSAIFFHVWRARGAGTLGCTAMSKDDLLTVMAWLHPAKHPLLIQAPRSSIAELR